MNKTITFEISDISNRTDRIDVSYFNPTFLKTMKILKKISKSKLINVDNLDSFLDKTSETCLTGGATPHGAIYVDDGISFVRIQNIKENEIDFESAVNIPIITHEGELSRSQLKPNDVLLTITGTYGISAVVPKNIKHANINQHVVKIEVNKSKILSEYLSLYLNSSICRNQMDREATGSSRLALDYTAIKSLKVVCPHDLKKQSEIVQKVSELEDSSKLKELDVDNILEGLNNIITEQLNFKISAQTKKFYTLQLTKNSNRLDFEFNNPFYKKFEKMIEKSKYPFMELDKLASPSAESVNPMKKPDKSFLYVDIGNVNTKWGTISGITMMGYEAISTRMRRKIHEGQILVSTTRPTRKSIAIVPKHLDDQVCSTGFAVLNPTKLVKTKFLFYVLRSDIATHQFRRLSSGSGYPEIGKGKDLPKIRLPRPELGIQEKIIKKLDEQVSKARILYEEADKKRKDAIALKNHLVLNPLSPL